MFQIVDLRLEDALMCELLYESRHEMTSTSGVVLGIFFVMMMMNVFEILSRIDE